MHLSFAQLIFTSRQHLSLHLSFASTVCSSQSPSHLQLSFAPLNCTCCLHLSFAHLIGTSSFHIMLTPLLCTHVRIPLTLLACISHVHLQFVSLLALQIDLSHAAFICNSECHLLFESMVCTSCPQSSLASLMCTSQLCLSYAALSGAFRLHSSFITSHMQLACAPLIRASPL